LGVGFFLPDRTSLARVETLAVDCFLGIVQVRLLGAGVIVDGIETTRYMEGGSQRHTEG